MKPARGEVLVERRLGGLQKIWQSAGGDFFRSLVTGLAALWATVSLDVLNVKNISWLAGGDRAQSFFGWAFFREAPWTFRIFDNPNYGLELASTVAYTGSVPPLAIFFKVLSPILPEVFQFHGIWILLALILQGFFAQRLLARFFGSISLRWIASLLFVFSPALLFRVSIAHESLIGHFIFLVALWVYFNENIKTRYWLWPVVIAIAMLLFPYFGLMIIPIWLADLIKRNRQNLDLRNLSAESLLVLLAGFVSSWQLGLFDGGVRGGGFGKFKMNVLAAFDSEGWSYVIPDLPNSHPYEYEGYNYLGLGGLLLLFGVMVMLSRSGHLWLQVVKRHQWLVMASLLLTLYSISNKIGIGPYTLDIPISENLKALGDVARASGRFFWPVYYLIFLAVVVAVVRVGKIRLVSATLLVAVSVQIADTSAGWLDRRKEINDSSNLPWPTVFEDRKWQILAENHLRVRTLPATSSYLWEDVAFLAWKNGIAMDGVYLARLSTEGKRASEALREELLVTGKLEEGTFYIVDPQYREEKSSELDSLAATQLELDGVLVLVSSQFARDNRWGS